MLGLLLLRHYSARAWTWPPLLWWETGLLLLLNGFSLSTAGPLFQPWAAEILQKEGRRHISSDLYLFPGAWPLIEPWAAEILQKGAPKKKQSWSHLVWRQVEAPLCGGSRPLTAQKGVQRLENGKDRSWCGGGPLFGGSRPLTAQKGVQRLEKGKGLSWCGGGPLFGGSRPLTAQKGVQRLEKGQGLSWCGGSPLFGGSRPHTAQKGVQR